MRLDYQSVKKYVRMECETAGIGVQFHNHLETPYTDGKCLHIRTPNPAWDDDMWLSWEYEMQHEVGHESKENCNPHWKEVLEDKKPKGLLAFLYNLIADHIQEKNRLGVYKGRDEVLKKGRAKFVSEVLLDADVMSKEMGDAGRVFRVLSVYDTHCRERWNEYLAGMSDVAKSVLPDEDKEMYNTAIKSGININEGNNMQDAYDIAKKLMELFPLPEDEEGGGDKEQDGEGGGESGGDGEGGKESKEVEGDADIDSLSYHTHYSKPKENKYSEVLKGTTMHYTGMDSERSEFIPRDYQLVDMKKEGKEFPIIMESIENIPSGKMLAGKIKRLLAAMKQTVWEHGHKRGSVSSKNLWKARKPIYSDEVFKRKTSKLDINTAVTVLCDASGSMAGSKYVHAAKASILLQETLQAINIPVEILAFTEDLNGPVHLVMSSFAERRVDSSEMAGRFATANKYLNQNSDGESIMWAYNRLMKREEKRKVLVVLSDGSPCAFNGEYLSEVGFTKDVVNSIYNKGKVELYGIGIMDDNVKHFYKDYAVINSADELENALLNVVKSKVLGG